MNYTKDMIFRDFLYLDRSLVRDFLAQAEGGIFDETKEKHQTAGKKGAGAKIGIHSLGVSGNIGSEKSVKTEATVKQVAASEFSRLYEYLTSNGLDVIEEASSDSTINKIQRKQILEVDARVKLSGIMGLFELMSTIGNFAPAMESIGASTSLDADMLRGMQAISSLGEFNKNVPLIATVNGDKNLKIALELNPEYVASNNWDAEATVLFKVQRIIKPDEKYLVGDPFGGLLQLMPQEERTNLAAKLNNDEIAKLGLGEMEIASPALIGTPIAIYR